jgi:gas vesicle protein
MTYHELPDTPHRHREGGGFVLGMLAGAAVGGGLALLFAPREGSEMRHGLATGAQQAGRRLTQAYGSVAGTARRGARRLSGYNRSLYGEHATTSAASAGEFGQAVGRDRAEDTNRVIGGAIGEARYEPAATEPSETGPGATSPARDSRSPLV